MSVEIRVRARARRDLEEATQWYEAQGTGLGNGFLDEVERAFEKIAENPLTYPEVHRETRRALFTAISIRCFLSRYETSNYCYCSYARQPRSTPMDDSHMTSKVDN